ncbi:MAG TPA: rhodanese-like domain-containing protein [Vicinamibacterales bacterium]|jgi:rhodanese-related sulfurtransferase
MKHVTAAEAHALQQQGHIYVDIRSSPEFEGGHPAGAVHVPLIEQDEDSGQLLPNPDFVRVMQANFAPDARLLIGCESGGRSARAVQILSTFGFVNVANVTGGFGGARDPMSGRIVDPGWAGSGLHVEMTTPPGRSYRDLAAKAATEK